MRLQYSFKDKNEDNVQKIIMFAKQKIFYETNRHSSRLKLRKRVRLCIRINRIYHTRIFVDCGL